MMPVPGENIYLYFESHLYHFFYELGGVTLLFQTAVNSLLG